MRIKIVSKNGLSNYIRILVMENEYPVGVLDCVKRIEFDPIEANGVIRVWLYIDQVMLDISPFRTDFEKPTLYYLHQLHNNAEFKRLGLQRIN